MLVRLASKILRLYAKAMGLKCGYISVHFQRSRLGAEACDQNLDQGLIIKLHAHEIASPQLGP